MCVIKTWYDLKHYLKNNITKFNSGNDNICWFGGIDDIDLLSEQETDFIGIDVANGYTISDMLMQLKK